MKKFIVALLIAGSLGAGGRYVYDNATVTECHDKKILFVKYGRKCETVKRFG